MDKHNNDDGLSYTSSEIAKRQEELREIDRAIQLRTARLQEEERNLVLLQEKHKLKLEQHKLKLSDEHEKKDQIVADLKMLDARMVPAHSRIDKLEQMFLKRVEHLETINTSLNSRIDNLESALTFILKTNVAAPGQPYEHHQPYLSGSLHNLTSCSIAELGWRLCKRCGKLCRHIEAKRSDQRCYKDHKIVQSCDFEPFTNLVSSVISDTK